MNKKNQNRKANKNKSKKVAPAVKGVRGRPAAKITLPEGRDFTATQILNAMERYKRPVTLVTVHNHIKKAIAAKRVKQVGSKPQKGKGHPTYIFRVVGKSVKKAAKRIAKVTASAPAPAAEVAAPAVA
jgi:hypothetical protein